MKTFYSKLFPLATFMILLFQSSSVMSQHCVDDVIFRPSDGKYYIFRGSEYARFNSFTNAFDVGYPKQISSDVDFNFADAFFNSDLDATVHMSVGANEIELFFKADKMVVYTVNTNTYSSTVQIGNNFSDMPNDWKTQGIDAAVSEGSNLFLVKGNTYRWYNIANGFANPPLTQQGLISDFNGLQNSGFTGIDGAYLDTQTGKLAWIRSNNIVEVVFSNGTTSNNSLEQKFPPWPWNPCNQPFQNGQDNLNAQIQTACGTPDTEYPFMVNSSNMNIPGTSLGTNIALDKVSVYITHPYIEDVTLSLVSPSGIEVALCSLQGADGDGFGTSSSDPLVFNMFATDIIPNTGGIVYTGSFKPTGNFLDFNNGASPIGTWKLKMCDTYVAGDNGTLHYIKLSFSGLPNAICKTGVSVNLDANGNAAITDVQINNASTSWNGLDPVGVSINPTTLTCSNVPNGTVTLTVQGNNGVSGTCQSSVAVKDVTNPIALCKQNVPVVLSGAGPLTITPQMIDNGSNDQCSIANRSLDPPSINSPGTFTINLTVTDVGGNTASCIGSVIASVNAVQDIASLTKFEVRPNPVSDLAVIDLGFNQMEAVQVSLINIMGQQVWAQKNQGNSMQFPVDLGDFPQGIYNAIVRTENGVSTRRIVVAR